MTRPKPHTRHKPKGFALIVVMWVVLIAGLILFSVQKAVHANFNTAYNELASVQAHWLARAGIAQALAILEDDATSADDMFEFWYSDSDYFEKVELLNGTFSVTAPPNPQDEADTARYGLIDHCARLNINVVSAKQLRTLIDMPSWLLNSILDWRDSDNDTRPGGAEALYYDQQEYPYLIRNGPFRTIDELRLVKGIDEMFFAAEDTNLNGILDPNEDDGKDSYPDDNADGQLTLGLAGLTSVYSYELNRTANETDRTNINTADKDTLVQEFNFTDGLAQAVTEYNANKKDKSKKRFGSLMDLLKVKAKKNSKKESDDEGKVKKFTVKWIAENLDRMTLTKDKRLPGRININTASRAVLMTLSQMTTTTADAILLRQTSGMGPFSSVGELFTDKIVTEKQFKASAERLTVRSSVFEIRSSGLTTWGIRRDIVAVVDRGSDPVNILYWYQSE